MTIINTAQDARRILGLPPRESAAQRLKRLELEAADLDEQVRDLYRQIADDTDDESEFDAHPRMAELRRLREELRHVSRRISRGGL